MEKERRGMVTAWWWWNGNLKGREEWDKLKPHGEGGWKKDPGKKDGPAGLKSGVQCNTGLIARERCSLVRLMAWRKLTEIWKPHLFHSSPKNSNTLNDCVKHWMTVTMEAVLIRGIRKTWKSRIRNQNLNWNWNWTNKWMLQAGKYDWHQYSPPHPTSLHSSQDEWWHVEPLSEKVRAQRT